MGSSAARAASAHPATSPARTLWARSRAFARYWSLAQRPHRGDDQVLRGVAFGVARHAALPEDLLEGGYHRVLGLAFVVKDGEGDAVHLLLVEPEERLHLVCGCSSGHVVTLLRVRFCCMWPARGRGMFARTVCPI